MSFGTFVMKVEKERFHLLCVSLCVTVCFQKHINLSLNLNMSLISCSNTLHKCQTQVVIYLNEHHLKKKKKTIQNLQMS